MKKFALWAVAVVVGLIAVNVGLRKISPSLDLCSHLHTCFHSLATDAKKSVPVDWEIKRIRTELARIEPDMHKNFSVLADEIVGVNNLKKEVADGQARLEEKRKELMTMKGDLETGSDYIVYAGVKHTADRVRDKLSHDFESFKVAEDAQKKREKLLENKEAALEAAKEQIEAMRGTKAQLEEQLASLEAEQRLLELAETKSRVYIDDSRISRVKASLDELRDRIESNKTRLALEQQFLADKVIDVKQEVKNKDVLKDMEAYFGKTPDKVAEKK